MISIKPLMVCASVGVACLAVASAVSGILASTGGQTTGMEAAVIAVTGLASIAGIWAAVRWAGRAMDRQARELQRCPDLHPWPTASPGSASTASGCWTSAAPHGRLGEPG